MIRALLRYDFGRIRPVYGCLLMLLAAHLLFPAGPFYVMDSGIIALALLIGCSVAIGVFSDPANTDTWIFSRGLTRDDLFYNRLVLGAVLIGVAALLPLLTVVLGLRTILHQNTSPYYPTVEWLELPMAGTFFLFAAFAFCAQTCLGSLTQLAGKRRSASGSRITSIIEEFIATFVIGGSFAFALNAFWHTKTWSTTAIIVFVIAVAVIWLLIIARLAWRNFEID